MVEISVCPNCGKLIEGPEYLTSFKKIPQNVGLDFDPVAGRFLCDGCNYSGLPIQIEDTEHDKIDFPNKKIGLPLARANPEFYQLIIISGLIMIVGLFVPVIGPVITLIGLLLLGYTFFRVPKYKQT
ncbi:hypothetical protein KKE92_04800 [Candidatus Micrarchaeota archaeon]|nr:hypothetical protein [Candidatus Micrarchaeota archaeon]